MRTSHLRRRAPVLGRTIKTEGLVRIGGVDLPPHYAAFLSKYLERFNGAEAARHMKGTGAPNYASVAACQILANAKVRDALRGALEERHQKSEHRVDEVARYWWSVATADPRELSQVIFTPCRYCHGEGHRYQETSVEYNDRFVRYEAEQARRDDLPPEKAQALDPLPEFERAFPVTDRRWVCREFGGLGFTTNRYPMRGSDWASTVERVFSDIGRPLPDGLEANSDHSCPACHGNGIATPWLADTRHLSREAALIFAGVRQTREGIEIKTLDRMAAMVKYEEIMGMAGPHRIELTVSAEQLSSEQLSAELARRGIVVDAEYEVLAEPNASHMNGSTMLALPRPDLLRPRQR